MSLNDRIAKAWLKGVKRDFTSGNIIDMEKCLCMSFYHKFRYHILAEESFENLAIYSEFPGRWLGLKDLKEPTENEETDKLSITESDDTTEIDSMIEGAWELENKNTEVSEAFNEEMFPPFQKFWVSIECETGASHHERLNKLHKAIKKKKNATNGDEKEYTLNNSRFDLVVVEKQDQDQVDSGTKCKPAIYEDGPNSGVRAVIEAKRLDMSIPTMINYLLFDLLRLDAIRYKYSKIENPPDLYVLCYFIPM